MLEGVAPGGTNVAGFIITLSFDTGVVEQPTEPDVSFGPDFGSGLQQVSVGTDGEITVGFVANPGPTLTSDAILFSVDFTAQPTPSPSSTPLSITSVEMNDSNNQSLGAVAGPDGTFSILEPTIARSPTSLAPSCAEGANAPSQQFEVWNSGTGTLSYSISDNVAWLSCSPASGTSTGEHDLITVNYSTSGLTAAGSPYNATITISGNASNSPQTVSVTLTVTSEPPPPPPEVIPFPEEDATHIDPDTLIAIRVLYDTGVDIETLTVWVDGTVAYDGEQEVLVPGYSDQWEWDEAEGFRTARRRGSSTDFVVVLDADPDFIWGSEVSVHVYVADQLGNATDTSWSFHTAALPLGESVAVSGGAGLGPQDHSSCAADSDGNTYIVWQEAASAGDYDVYVAKSSDGGESFSEPVALASSSSNETNPVLAVHPAGVVFAAWQEDGSVDQDVQVAISSDGDTWVEGLLPSQPGNQANPSIAADMDGNVYVVWEDDRYAAPGPFGSSDILGAVSSDGLNWTPLEIAIADGDQTSPTIAVDADSGQTRVYVAWEDTRGVLDRDIYGASSSDGGLTWTEVPMAVGSGEQRQPDLDAGAGKWHLVYAGTDPYDLTDSIFYLGSGLGSPLRVDRGPIGTNQKSPTIVLEGDSGSVLVAWIDDRWDCGDVLVAEGRTYGTPVFGRGTLVNDDEAGNAQSKPDLILSKEGNLTISSTDSRDGVDGVYVTSASLQVGCHEELVSADEDTLIEVSSGPLAGTMVFIPAKAFATDTWVRICNIDDPPGTMPSSQFGPVVGLGPSGPSFGWPWYADKEAIVSIPHDATLEHETDRYYVYRYSLLDGSWLEGHDVSNVTHLDVGGGIHVMEFNTGHFSMFCTVGRKSTPNGGGCLHMRNVGGSPSEDFRDAVSSFGLLLLVLLFIRVAAWRRSRRFAGSV